jgi:ribonuclease R
MDDAPRIKMSQAEHQAWEAAGLHCSANERRADEASRDVEAWLKCKYMREHLGEEYSGVVTSATSFGIFVTLDNLYVEGLVHITELGGEYFRFDEARQELRGERTGIRYAIGTRVQIQVSRVDLDGRKIDFRLVNPAEEFSPRQMRDKGPGKQGGSRNENGKGSARGAMAGAETAKSKSHSFNVRKAEGGKPSMRHGKVSPKGAPSKSAGSKKSSQARKSCR